MQKNQLAWSVQEVSEADSGNVRLPTTRPLLQAFMPQTTAFFPPPALRPVQPVPRCTALDPLKIHVKHLNLLKVSVLWLCLCVHVATYMYIYKKRERERYNIMYTLLELLHLSHKVSRDAQLMRLSLIIYHFPYNSLIKVDPFSRAAARGATPKKSSLHRHTQHSLTTGSPTMYSSRQPLKLTPQQGIQPHGVAQA